MSASSLNLPFSKRERGSNKKPRFLNRSGVIEQEELVL